MAPAPIIRLLGDTRFAVLAGTLLTLPYWTSGIAKLFDLAGERNIFLEHVGLIGGLMVAAILRERRA